MLELSQQPRQPLNLHKPVSTGIGARLEVTQHPVFQRLGGKMQAHFMMNAGCEMDHDIIKHFCERVLPVTFLSWMCKS